MLEPEIYSTTDNHHHHHHHHFKNHHRHLNHNHNKTKQRHFHHSDKEKLQYQPQQIQHINDSGGYFKKSFPDHLESINLKNANYTNINNNINDDISNSSDNNSCGNKKRTIVYVGDGRSRVRRVVRTQTRHITVVSYSGRKKETETHTSHHATILSFPQKTTQIYSTHHHHPSNFGSGSEAELAQLHPGVLTNQSNKLYSPPQQLVYHPQQNYHHGSHQNIATPTLHKKGSIRNNGDVLKRSRVQNAYELSQDLLDKQIELLERKYGGVIARNAALTIQRAFRHYTMVKKFASITAMAKAEKRMSRRPPSTQPQQNDLDMSSQSLVDGHPIYDEPGNEAFINGQRVCATISATSQRITPVRSMSLRERRMDAGPIPRSQSGTASPAPTPSWSQSQIQPPAQYSHPHVNILHQPQQIYYSSPPPPSSLQQQQYQSQYGSQDLNISGGSQLDSTLSSMNLSWNSTGTHQSPYTPHYTATQIYMRPRGSVVGSSGGSSGSGSRKVPPEVPKRTSSITGGQNTPNRSLRPNGLCKSAENGSLSSVQSSGSDSSADRVQGVPELCQSDRSSSPQWKRKPSTASLQSAGLQLTAQSPDHMITSSSANVTISSVDNECLSSHTSAAQYSIEQHDQIVHTPTNYKVSETIRKRQYRVGLNLFNKKPERGITYLIRKGFLENTPQGVARFLISRKGLSRQMIGEYLGNLQNTFNMAVLECFAGELDLSGMQVDVALRKFQGYFRMPGEAQKIERLMEVFSQRYCLCNSDIVARLRSNDTVFVLAFAIIMLNTDLHTPNLKPDRRMRCDDYIKNLRGIDDCHDIDRDMLTGIYDRVKANEFKPGSDHVTQVMKVQATIVGKKPNLALPHRRLVCYCRLYEIPDINRKERPGVHQREVFLFNDLLVITKIFSKKKSSVTYTFRNSYPLCGMVVTLLDVPNYPYCIRLSQKVDGKVLVTFNARNEHDRCKFAEDLRESISEMDEMEQLRIETELDRQKSARGNHRSGNSENRDSGVADVEVCAGQYPVGSHGGISPNECGITHTHSEAQLKRSALSNSLLDMHEQFGNEKPQRRGSVGSLDSGIVSISFQSTSASTGSRSDSKVRVMAHSNTAGQIILPQQQQQLQQQQSQILFHNNNIRRERKISRSDENGNNGGNYGRSTEV